jgi:ABC-type transport system substrate-binding protein
MSFKDFVRLNKKMITVILCLTIAFVAYPSSRGAELYEKPATPLSSASNQTVKAMDTASGSASVLSPSEEGWVPFIPGASPGSLSLVSLKCSDNTGIDLDSDIAGMFVANVSVNGTTYQRLEIPQEGHTGETGKPEVPVIKSYLEIPYDVDLAVEILYSSFTALSGYNVFPVQEPLTDMKTDETPRFVIDGEAYSSDEFYPSYSASIDEPVIMRGHRIVPLSLYPVQYNSITKQLNCYSKIEVRVSYDHPAQIEGIEERLESEAFEELCKTFILNYKSPERYVTRRSGHVGSPAADYLIITNSTFSAQVQPLANWKQRKGYRTEVVTTSTIGSTAIQIKQYIQNAYNSWNPPPTYILLVGDVKLADGGTGVPTNYGLQSSSSDAGRIGTDLNYSRLDGDDYFPDVFIGRIPVKTTGEATTVINKMLDYERNPPIATNWFDDALVAWSTERQFWIDTGNMIGNYLQSNGYTNHSISVSSGSGGAATPQVIGNISAGCFIVTHRDHGDSLNGPGGSTEGWVDPSFTVANVGQLTNDNMLPVMFSINCRSGWFDGETDEDSTDPSGGVDCLGEAWLKTNNRGGVGFIGSTRISYTGYNDYLCRGFYDAIWPDFLSPTQNAMYKLGQVLTYGKINMVSYKGYGDSVTRIELEEFHLLGDPEMSIWTRQPQPLTATYPSTIGSGGSQKFVVKVTDGINPVQHALVCLSKTSDVYTFDYTDAGGFAVFDITPSTGGSLDITVTKHNYLPHQGSITVTSNGASITVSPDTGPPSTSFTIVGNNFNDGETVNINFGTVPLPPASASGGSFSVSRNVPSVPEGPTNVVAVGQSSGRTAVAVYRVLPTQPLPDPHTYSQWDSSTWYLNPGGGDPIWNNPCIQLKEKATGNIVASGNLVIGVTYVLEATVYNFATVGASGTQVSFEWARLGIGQPHWEQIGTVTVNVPASPGNVKASVEWTPIQTGHCCIVAEIYHPWDSNTNNNKGQENCDVRSGSSPTEISFIIHNPTNTTGLVYLELTQQGGTGLWENRIERPYPQVLEPGQNQTATLTVIVPDCAEPGETRSLMVTGSINGQAIGGVEFQVVKVQTPHPDTLMIHIYDNPDAENTGLDTGLLDITDWPLSSDWITRFAAKPESITMRSYAENGMFEFDLNNQAWPTGWPGKDTGSARNIAAKYFRQAIAHLTDKVKIVSDILKGYGTALKVPLPPSLNAYVYDPGTDYEYSRKLANDTLYAGGFYYEGGLWKWTGGEILPKLKMYLRLDDPNRRTAGEYLVTELRALGFGDAQLDVKITERTVCYQYVMVLYDFSIYTGGWSLGADPDSLYDLYNSKYGYNGWGAPAVGWASNYPGVWRDDYDTWSAAVKYAPDEASLRQACFNATKIFWENEFIVSLWSASSVKAYRTCSKGVVNMDGYGIDNRLTFMRMAGSCAVDGKIDWGFCSEPEQLHPVCSQGIWDWKALGLVYDGLIGRDLYQLSEVQYWLATAYSVGTWDGGTKTKVEFTPRAGVTWHDGVAFTVDDIIFSWEFTKKCGLGVAWNCASIADMNHTAIEGGKAVIYYNVLSMFAKWWAGGLPILPKHIWEARFPDWNTPSFNPSTVRTYHSWEVKLNWTEGGVEIPGHPGEYFTELIGCGPWIFPYGGWTKGESIKLFANTNYYMPPSEIENNVVHSFWKYKGDATARTPVPYDVGRISGADILLVIAHYAENYPACDFNENGVVDAEDFNLVTSTFGKVAG